MTDCNLLANSAPMINAGGSGGSGKGLMRSLVGGEGVISGHVDATSSAKNRLVGDGGRLPLVDELTRRKPSMLGRRDG